MPSGVIRPYTLPDVLATIYNQTGQGAIGSATALTTPLSNFAEADEAAITTADSAFGASQTNITWDQGVWSAGSWS